MNTLNKISFLILFVAFFSGVSAQGVIDTEVVSVKKSYVPVVEEMELKKLSPPEPTDKEISKQNLDYKIYTPDIKFDFKPKEISIVEYENPNKPNVTPQNFIEASFGTKISAKVDGFYQIDLKNNSFSAKIHHDNLLKNVKNFDKKALFSKSEINLGYKHDFEKYYLGVNADFTYQTTPFTGLPTPGVTADFSLNDLQTQKNSITPKVSFFLVPFQTQKIFQGFVLNYQYYQNNLSVNEHQVFLDTKINFSIKNFGFGLPVSTSFISTKRPAFTTELLSSINSLTKLSPEFYYRIAGIDLALGADIQIDYQSYGGSNVLIMPKVNADLQIVKGILSIHGSFSSDIENMSISDLNNINPYLSAWSNFFNAKTLALVNLGFEGLITSKIRYSLDGFYRYRSKELAFVFDDYINFADKQNYVNTNSFIPDADKSNLINVKGILSYQISNNILVDLNAQYNYSKADKYEKILYLPDFEVGTNFYGNFLNGKLSSELNFCWKGDYYANVNNITIRKKGFPVYGAKISYNVYKNWHVFTQADNNVFGKVFPYIYYPQTGFRILFGASYRFN